MTVNLVGWLLLAAHVVLGLIAAIYIAANRRPAEGIAWVLTIIFLPFVGVVAFLLIGNGKLPKSRRAKQREVCDLILERTDGLSDVSHPERWPEWLPLMATLNRNLGSLPMVGGNSARLLPDYVGMIDAIIADIDDAKSYVHVEFFILAQDRTTRPFFDALERACGRGVTVRVLTDYIGCRGYDGWREMLARLESMGAEFHLMLPIKLRRYWMRPDLRNHRKIVVIDGVVAHTGSLNMIDSQYHKKKNIERGLHWRELMARFEGPVVRELDAVFVTDWYSECEELLALDTTPVRVDDTEHVLDAQVVPSGPSFDNDNNLKLFAAMIQNARYRIGITSPYFVPDETLLVAMITAASRDVHIELFVSAISDQFLVYHAQRSYYEALLRAGVEIYLYFAPTVLHSKHLSFDDDVAIIGSSNLDIRSLSLHMEQSVLVHSRSFVADMRKIEDDYRANSVRLTLEDWLQRHRRERAFDNLARLTSFLM